MTENTKNKIIKFCFCEKAQQSTYANKELGMPWLIVKDGGEE